MVSKVKNVDFWVKKGDSPSTIGDLLGRKSALKLISPKKGEYILDAGCGTGYMSRRFAKKGAKVWGCDVDKGMLNKATEEESIRPLGIEYLEADICNLPYEDNSFDKVCAVGVLMYNNPEEIVKFFRESRRVLKKDGKLFYSLTHPRLYQEDSYARTQNDNWVRFSPLEKDLDYSKSIFFKEEYDDNSGATFEINIWYHPKNILHEALQASGLDIIHSQTKYLTRELLEQTGQKGQVNFPAYLQEVARNGSF